MKLENLKEKAVQDYEKYVRFVIKNMNLSYKTDDIYDVGLIGFVNGINTYDSSKGVKYTTYLYECIKNEILHYLNYEKREMRSGNVISLNKIVNDIELIDIIPIYQNYDRNIYLEEVISVINRRLSKLNKRDEDIFKHLFGIDGYKKMNSIELEKKYKMTRQNIMRIKNKILNMLRYEIRDYYNSYQDICVERNMGK